MSQLEYNPENEPFLVKTIPGPLPPVPSYLIRRRKEFEESSVPEKSDAQIIAEEAVATVEADTRPMSEHYKLMRVASLVAEKCLMQQNIVVSPEGSENV